MTVWRNQCYIFNFCKIPLQCSAKKRILQRHVPSTAIYISSGFWAPSFQPLISALHISRFVYRCLVAPEGHRWQASVSARDGPDEAAQSPCNSPASPMTVLLLRAPVSCSSRPVAPTCRCSQPFGYATITLVSRARSDVPPLPFMHVVDDYCCEDLKLRECACAGSSLALGGAARHHSSLRGPAQIFSPQPRIFRMLWCKA